MKMRCIRPTLATTRLIRGKVYEGRVVGDMFICTDGLQPNSEWFLDRFEPVTCSDNYAGRRLYTWVWHYNKVDM